MMCPLETNNTPKCSLPSNHQFLSKYQIVLPPAIANLTLPVGSHQRLEDGFKPSDYDVVCGRGKGSYNRPGNKRFRQMIRQHLPAYQAAKSKVDKSIVLNRIMDQVRSQNNGSARFVKLQDKVWCEISDEQAREKIGHTLREQMAQINTIAEKQVKQEAFSDKQNDLLAQQKALFETMINNK